MEKRGDGRVSIWCKAPPGSQMVLVGADPERFFVPPYVGHKGWVGMRLDRRPDWDEVAAVGPPQLPADRAEAARDAGDVRGRSPSRANIVSFRAQCSTKWCSADPEPRGSESFLGVPALPSLRPERQGWCLATNLLTKGCQEGCRIIAGGIGRGDRHDRQG